jgi:GH18 family chitinase
MAACAPPGAVGDSRGVAGDGYRVVGYYFAPTVGRGFPVTRVDGARLTHLNYAFGNVTSEGLAVPGNPSPSASRWMPTAARRRCSAFENRYPRVR